MMLLRRHGTAGYYVISEIISWAVRAFSHSLAKALCHRVRKGLHRMTRQAVIQSVANDLRLTVWRFACWCMRAYVRTVCMVLTCAHEYISCVSTQASTWGWRFFLFGLFPLCYSWMSPWVLWATYIWNTNRKKKTKKKTIVQARWWKRLLWTWVTCPRTWERHNAQNLCAVLRLCTL